MVLKYRLGLDVGTASVGAAAVSLDEKGLPLDLVWHHVRIFSEPLDNAQGTLVSKKAGRRKARMQRRQIDRRAARLKSIAQLSSLIGINRADVLPDNELPAIRAQAATQRVELADMLRIFLRMSKRRGYRGEFKAKKKGEVAQGSHELSNAMRTLASEQGVALQDEHDTGITLGQFLYHRLQSGLPIKLKIKEISDEPKPKKGEDSPAPKNLYALRSMVEHEFRTIWATQAQHHPVLNGEHQGKPIQQHFFDTLFLQRPLKSAADLVAQCSLEPTLARAPRAQMAFQRFRIEKTLADLRWGAGKNAVEISPAQKSVLRALLDQNDKVKFPAIYEALEKAGCPKPVGKGLNLDRASREELQGNQTLSALRALDKYSAKHHPDRATQLEAAFRALDNKTQIAVINFLADIGSPEQLDDPAWHTSFVKSVKDVKVKDNQGKDVWKYKDVQRIFSIELVGFINHLKEHDNFDRLGSMKFDGGRASYSVKALNTLADWMEEPHWAGDWDNAEDGVKSLDEEGAVRACYRERIKAQRVTQRRDNLPPPDATGNAVVDGSLLQIRWTINKMIAELGAPPSEIVVEMAREMSLGITRRNEREADNTKQQKARKVAEAEINKLGQTATPSKIRRYLLWEEQDTHCPYCEIKMCLSDALDGGATEFEHIIPKSLTQVGLKNSEIVLAHRICNHEKGDRTPHQVWGNTPRWAYIKAAAKRFEDKKRFRKAKLLLLEDFEYEVLTDKSVAEFSDRQFHQTSWIAKAAAQWLDCLCPNQVSVSRGELTSQLRSAWKLATVIPEVRYESNLPVLDTGGADPKKDPAKPITPEDFAVLKKYLERSNISREERKADMAQHPDVDTNRRPDKRIDHRHHLIDAITLALTSRSLFQQMARDYKIAAEQFQPIAGESPEDRESRLKQATRPRLKTPAPPMRHVRQAALEAVRACRISIKPDRYPDGALFKGTAYGTDQREGEDRLRLTLRQSVADMGKVKGKTSVESARKVIDRIVSGEVRHIVSEHFEDKIATGMDAATALALPIRHPLYRTPIRKVRCFEGYAEEAQPIVFKSRQGEHRKYLVNEGYAYLELFTDGSKPPQLVKIRDAMKDKRKPKPSNVVRIYKGDTIFHLKNKQNYLVRSFKAENGGQLFVTVITETRPVKEMNAKDGFLKISGKNLSYIKLV